MKNYFRITNENAFNQDNVAVESNNESCIY